LAVDGTQRLLDAIDAAGIDRLVLVSSFSVYDYAAIRRTIHERSPVIDESRAGADGYARAKVAQENLVRRWGENKQLTVLRPGAVWDVGHWPAYAIGQSVGPLLFIIGPSRPLHLVHVDNCARLIARSVDEPAAVGQTLNLVDSDRVTAWRMGSELAKQWGKKPFPLPTSPGRWVGKAIYPLMKIVSLDGKLPSLLVPCRYRARFNSLAADNDRMKRCLGWPELLTYERCLRLSDSVKVSGNASP
jgi:nucleoside-diphosphate-sugar epimerase